MKLLIFTLFTFNLIIAQIKSNLENNNFLDSMTSTVYVGMTEHHETGETPSFAKFATNNQTDLQYITFLNNIPPGAGAIDPNNPNSIYYIKYDYWDEEVTLRVFNFSVHTIIGVLDFDGWRGLEFDPTSGILYAITTDALYTIDLTTAIPTFIGETGITTTSLAIDGNGDIFSYDIINDNFYSLDKNSGESTLIGPLGFNVSDGGMAWDSNTDGIYLTSYNSNGDTDFRILDKNTGSSSILGILDGGYEIYVKYYYWISFDGSNLGYIDNNALSFNFFPNPTNEIFSYKSSLKLKSITILDLLGNTVVEINEPASEQEINISYFSAGMYFMKVESHDKVATYKIVKE